MESDTCTNILEMKPALLTHFEPWYPLLWTDGSIGFISTAEPLLELKLYSGNSDKVTCSRETEVQTGSNGFALAPSKTASGNSILYQPAYHFLLLDEVKFIEEGLNVYRSSYLGQFFIYQGFNDYCGWMHTSSNIDVLICMPKK
jgi:acyl-homoserine lactone acylase PvdQ